MMLHPFNFVHIIIDIKNLPVFKLFTVFFIISPVNLKVLSFADHSRFFPSIPYLWPMVALGKLITGGQCRRGVCIQPCQEGL